MVEQLDLQGDRYLLIVAIFFMSVLVFLIQYPELIDSPYVIFEFPSNLLMSKSSLQSS
jgi:hypothetical protein